LRIIKIIATNPNPATKAKDGTTKIK